MGAAERGPPPWRRARNACKGFTLGTAGLVLAAAAATLLAASQGGTLAWQLAGRPVRQACHDEAMPVNGSGSSSGVYRHVLYRGPDDARLELRSCSNSSNPQLPPAPPSWRPHKLVSVLLYMNEEDLMHVRLLEHYEAVDLFVVVEAPFTFTGNPKPLHFGEALCRRFERFTAKIVHVVTDFPDAVWKAQPVKAKSRFANDAWRREFAIRNSFHTLGPLLGLQPRDLLLHSDVDEIPTAAGVRQAANLLWNGLASTNASVQVPAVNFDMKMYYYNLHISLTGDAGRDNAGRLRVTFYDALRTCLMKTLRGPHLAVRPCHEVHNLATLACGVHATYFAPPDRIALKLRSFSHTEASGANFTAVDIIKRKIRELKDPRDKGWQLSWGEPADDPALRSFTPAARDMLLGLSERLTALQSQ